MEKSKLIQARTLKGFRDFLPDAMCQKENMISIIKEVYKSYGFVPIDTPILEYAEILKGKGGEESDKQMYEFKDKGNRSVAMRFDLTIPFARFTAQHYNDLVFPFKRYHIGKVWRGENTQAGRYRELSQCDFDIIGTTSIISDIETVSIIYDTIASLGIKNFTIQINNRIIMNGLLKKLSVFDKQVEILRAIDKLSKIGKDKVSEILKKEIKLSENQIKDILTFISIKGTNENILKQIKDNFSGEELIDKGINQMEKIIDSLISSGISEDNYKIDPSITRGLDYYTGLVVETILNDLPEYGSMCSGGRYDNLAGLYTKNILPGVGASIGIDRLLAALKELNMLQKRESYIDVLILNLDENLRNYYLNLARNLRKEGISTEVYPDTKKLNKQFAFADKKGFILALIIGEEEKQKGIFNIRKIESGERVDGIKIENIVKEIKNNL